MKHNKTIIFDFDGTIADSLPIMLRIYGILLPKGPEITKELFQFLRKLPAHKVAAHLDVSLWRLPWLLRRGRKTMHDHMNDVQPIDGIEAVIKELTKRGYNLHIVTSNSRANVLLFLRMHKLDGYFDDVHAVRRLNGKPRALKALARKLKVDVHETYYVGDEARDIAATQRIQMPIVAVSWGFNDIALLKEMNPTKTAQKPKDLLRIFS